MAIIFSTQYFNSIKLMLLVILITLGCFSDLRAQLNKIGDPPLDVLKEFNKKHPEHDVNNWIWDPINVQYICKFNKKGIEHEALISAFGNWIRTERALDAEDLPREITWNISKSTYNNWQIAKVYEQETKKYPLVYKVVVLPPGKTEKSRKKLFLHILPDGTLVDFQRNI